MSTRKGEIVSSYRIRWVGVRCDSQASLFVPLSSWLARGRIGYLGVSVDEDTPNGCCYSMISWPRALFAFTQNDAFGTVKPWAYIALCPCLLQKTRIFLPEEPCSVPSDMGMLYRYQENEVRSLHT